MQIREAKANFSALVAAAEKGRPTLISRLAALAQHAGLLLLTCKLKHFQPLGVPCADPLIALPAVLVRKQPAWRADCATTTRSDFQDQNRGEQH